MKIIFKQWDFEKEISEITFVIVSTDKSSFSCVVFRLSGSTSSQDLLILSLKLSGRIISK